MIILDCNYMCHAAKHSNDLNHYGVDTGVIYGFMSRMLFLAKHFDDGDFVFCWDSLKSRRTHRHPFYKLNRKTKVYTEEEQALNESADRQFEILRTEILPYLGFRNIWMKTGFEGDDLIARAVEWAEENGELPPVIVSADHDLLQLVDRASLYKPTNRMLITMDGFVEEWGIHPKEWATVKAIAGCQTDNVPGIRGVGEKTAVKYLLNQLKSDSAKYQAIMAGFDEVFSRNLWLVTLPLEGTPKMVVERETGLCWSCFIEVCEKYGFKSFLNAKKEWAEFIFDRIPW